MKYYSETKKYDIDTISTPSSQKHLVLRKKSDTKECVVWHYWYETLENAVFSSGNRQKPRLGVGWTAKGPNETGDAGSILHLNAAAAADYICKSSRNSTFKLHVFYCLGICFQQNQQISDFFLHRLICIICSFLSKHKSHSYKSCTLEFVFNGLGYHSVLLKIRQWMVKSESCLSCQRIIGPQMGILNLRVPVNCLKGWY